MGTKIAIFGFGFVGKWFANEIGYENVEVIIDNNDSLWGTRWNGIEINSLDKFHKKNSDLEIVITATKYEEEIVNQLRNAGYDKYSFYYDVWLKNNIQFNKDRKRIFLMNAHSYVNVGDYAITQAEMTFLKEYFPEFQIEIVPSLICRDGMHTLKEYVLPNDIILISGGGYLGNLWLDCGETNVRMIVSNFGENKVVILPQTIFFTDDEAGKQELKITKHFYNEHSNLTICLREQKSYELSQNIFDSKITCKYIPDMVLFLDKSREVYDRKGVVLCFRNDKESITSPERLLDLEKLLNKMHVSISKMSMEANAIVRTHSYETIVNEKMDIVQRSRLVITDRLHCMLLCAISGTPCIAFNNISGKVKGVWDWINHLPYIRFMDIDGEWEKDIQEMLRFDTQYTYHNEKSMSAFRELVQVIKK